jgi:hypothetical protein
MLARRKIAFPKGRKKLPQETSLSVLKKVGNNSCVSRVSLTSEDWFFFF